MVERLSQQVGILCLTEVPDSLLMWAHYADSHKGFLVGFNTTHTFFTNMKVLEPVIYSETRVRVPLETMFDKVKYGRDVLRDCKDIT